MSRSNDDSIHQLHLDNLRLSREVGERQRAEMADFLAAQYEHARAVQKHEASTRAHAVTLQVYEERDALVAELDEGHFAPPTVAEVLEPLRRYAVVSTKVAQLIRETYVDVPGGRFTVDVRHSSLDPTAKRPAFVRLADFVAQALPRRNACVFAYIVEGRGSLSIASLGGLVADLQRLVGDRIVGEVERRLKSMPRAAHLVLDARGWAPLPSEFLEEEVGRICSSFPLNVTVTSSNPAPGAGALVANPVFEGEVLRERAEVLVDAIRRLMVSSRQPLPIRPWRLPPPTPVDVPSAPPPVPRLADGTYAYWRELPFEVHYEREVCADGVPSERVLLGFSQADSGEWGPLLLSRSQLQAHAHFTGATRSGKSALLALVAAQVIRGSESADRLPATVVVVDPKAESFLKETCRIEALKRRMRFRFFTPDPNRESETLDLLGSLLSVAEDPETLGEVLGRGLELYYGPGYGRSHFGRQNQTTTAVGLGAMLKDVAAGKPLTFEGIIKALEKVARSKRPPPGFNRTTATEALATLRALAARRRLVPNADADPRDVIHLDAVLENRELLYIHCPLASPGSLDIARLILFVLSELCRKRSMENRKRQCFAFVDEFAELLGQNVGTILSTAAGSGLTLLLANQSLSQLRLGNLDLTATVEANVHLRVFLTASEQADVEEVQRLSGEKLEWFRQVGFSADQKTGRGVADSLTWGVMNGITTGSNQFSSVSASSGTSSGSGPGGATGSTQSGSSITHGRGSSVAHSQSTSEGGSHTESAQKVDGTALQVSFRETPRPVLGANDVARISSRRTQGFLWVRQDDGASGLHKAEGRLKPFHILYLTDEREYEARLQVPWRKVASSVDAAPSPTPQPRSQTERPARAPKPVPAGTPRARDPKQIERGTRLNDFFVTHYPKPPENGR